MNVSTEFLVSEIDRDFSVDSESACRVGPAPGSAIWDLILKKGLFGGLDTVRIRTFATGVINVELSCNSKGSLPDTVLAKLFEFTALIGKDSNGVQLDPVQTSDPISACWYLDERGDVLCDGEHDDGVYIAILMRLKNGKATLKILNFQRLPANAILEMISCARLPLVDS